MRPLASILRPVLELLQKRSLGYSLRQLSSKIGAKDQPPITFQRRNGSCAA